MEKVSTGYSSAMKEALRERGYLRVTVGLINQEAQSKAVISGAVFAPFSSDSNIFIKSPSNPSYATMETDFTPADGSLAFLPRTSTDVLYTGLTSSAIVTDDAPFSMYVSFGNTALDVKGLEIDFGKNPPENFTVTSDSGDVETVTGNTDTLWHTETVFENATYLLLSVTKMTKTGNRVRIKSINLGYGLIYCNDKIIDSSLTSYTSPIGDDLPQIDFSVTIDNSDQYFDFDNPSSALNFFEGGQPLDVYYGMTVGSSVEWVKGGHFLVSDWDANSVSATIKAVDTLRNLDSDYYKGKVRTSAVSFATLATEVFTEAGITDYTLDPILSDVTTKNPIPLCTIREALQMIANACRCTLSVNREGGVSILCTDAVTYTAAAVRTAPYSKVSNILADVDIVEYARLDTDYVHADGTMLFMPRSSPYDAATGFVSEDVSGSSAFIAGNYPSITVTQSRETVCTGFRIEFGENYTTGINISTFLDGSAVETLTLSSALPTSSVLDYRYDFEPFDTITFTFTGDSTNTDRIIVKHLDLGYGTSFRMRYDDMFEIPTISKADTAKRIEVTRHSYSQKGSSESVILEESVTVSANEILLYTFDETFGSYRATINGSSSGISIQASGAHYAEIKITTAGTYTLILYGIEYVVTDKTTSRSVSSSGDVITWDNPLLWSSSSAGAVADWLKAYYTNPIEYDYDHRGFPELDVADIIHQDNAYNDRLRVDIVENTTTFDGAFGGHIVTRRRG